MGARAQPAGGAERQRLLEDRQRSRNWTRWGPYLAERQWGTVREDYSVEGDAWAYLPHDHARSRAYRWGEDGLLGWCDRECRRGNPSGPAFARQVCLFLPGPDGRRPCHGADAAYASDPHFRDLVLFHEFFHGDTGLGLGASHQTGWSVLVAKLIEDQADRPRP